MSVISVLKSGAVAKADKVALVTSKQNRFEGILDAVDWEKGTVELRDVRVFQHKKEEADSDTCYHLVTFRIANVESVTKIDRSGGLDDCAVVAVEKASKKDSHASGDNCEKVAKQGHQHARNRQLRQGFMYPANWTRPKRPRRSGKRAQSTQPYDFEKANAQLEEDLAKLSVSGVEQETFPIDDSKADSGHEASNEMVEVEKSCYYAPAESFFDYISRPPNSYVAGKGDQSAKQNREGKGLARGSFRNQKQLNIETFGQLAARSSFYRRQKPRRTPFPN